MIHTLSGFTNPVMKKHKLVTNVIQHNVLSGNGNVFCSSCSEMYNKNLVNMFLTSQCSLNASNSYYVNCVVKSFARLFASFLQTSCKLRSAQCFLANPTNTHAMNHAVKCLKGLNNVTASCILHCVP